MSKTFRAWHLDQEWLLPQSLHDFVPPDHPAHLVRELVARDHAALADASDPDYRFERPPAAARPTLDRPPSFGQLMIERDPRAVA